MSPPLRIQLSRKKGSKLPANTVNVARPGKWGNPFKVKPGENPQFAIACFEDFVKELPEYRQQARKELRGKNLACWCPPGSECHADILLRIANEDEPCPK